MAEKQVRSDFKSEVVVVVTWKNMTAYPATLYAGKQVDSNKALH